MAKIIDAPRLRLASARFFERDVPLRLPFRFGVTTVTHARQIVARVEIETADGARTEGVAAESLAAKWFDKNLALTDDQNLDQLRQAVVLAVEHYTALGGLETAFGHFARCYKAHQDVAGKLDLSPLVAGFGPALLDRAIIDALLRHEGMSFAAGMRANIAGMETESLTPDLAGFDLAGFLGRMETPSDIHVRHTVGLVDPITAADRPEGDRVNDGLPETLEEVVDYYGGRYYKLKVGGNIEEDLDRLTRIAGVLDARAGDYLVTLDGNEQYEDVEGISELWRRMIETP